jgi:DNA-binding beta-propeller fold protein YncE
MSFTLARYGTFVGLLLTACFLSTSESRGDAGQIIKTYDWRASAFLAHPTRPIVYASLEAEDAVAIINTDSLEVNKIYIGSEPTGMALSNDLSKLYVANRGSSSIGILDTINEVALAPLSLPTAPLDVEVGKDGRLFTLVSNKYVYARLEQLDPETGEMVGPRFGGSFYYGELEMSPDKNRLYYGDYSLSPSDLTVYDVSTPGSTQYIHSIRTGSSGADLALSQDGRLIAHANGSPYSIAIYSAGDDLALLGTLETGNYPSLVAFSPDGEVAYTVNDNRGIKVWSTSTFQQTDTFAGGPPKRLGVDTTGSLLFASYWGSYSSSTIVMDTGRYVPEPGSSAILCGSSIVVLSRWRHGAC